MQPPPSAQRSDLVLLYFFFFEVFFATFLVAFAVFAFLAMSSSVKIDSVNMRMPSIDMHNTEKISRMQN